MCHVCMHVGMCAPKYVCMYACVRLCMYVQGSSRVGLIRRRQLFRVVPRQERGGGMRGWVRGAENNQCCMKGGCVSEGASEGMNV